MAKYTIPPKATKGAKNNQNRRIHDMMVCAFADLLTVKYSGFFTPSLIYEIILDAKRIAKAQRRANL